MTLPSWLSRKAPPRKTPPGKTPAGKTPAGKTPDSPGRAGNPGGLSPTRVLFTTHRYPVYYLAITKCGCTFLKNLFWQLDHGEPHPDADNIHRYEDGIPRATDRSVEDIHASAHAFVVIRDPVDRFLSLYFDKIWGDGPQAFDALRLDLARSEGIALDRGLDAAGHRRNAKLLIDWLERNLRGETARPPNPHWRPQSQRLWHARRLKLRQLTLDGLDWQLPRLLGDIIPDIQARMDAVKARNRTPRPVGRDDLADPALVEAVNRVYAADRRAYDRQSAIWARQRRSRTERKA
jgi:hypothetical protein